MRQKREDGTNGKRRNKRKKEGYKTSEGARFLSGSPAQRRGAGDAGTMERSGGGISCDSGAKSRSARHSLPYYHLSIAYSRTGRREAAERESAAFKLASDRAQRMKQDALSGVLGTQKAEPWIGLQISVWINTKGQRDKGSKKEKGKGRLSPCFSFDPSSLCPFVLFFFSPRPVLSSALTGANRSVV